MDRQVRKRLNQDIIIYPCLGIIDGDSTWDTPLLVKGFEMPKYRIITNRSGVDVQVSTCVIMDAEYLTIIKTADEIQTQTIARSPIKAIIPYAGLHSKCELIEVYL